MRRKLWRRSGFTMLLAAMLGWGPIMSLAATPPVAFSESPANDVFITEVQTASAAAAGEEFVELYNNTDEPIMLGDGTSTAKDQWKLQYFAGSSFDEVRSDPAASRWSATPTSTILLKGTIQPHDYYLLASSLATGTYAPGGIEADGSFTPRLSDNGALQLVDVPSTTSLVFHDRVLWSSRSDKQGGLLNVLTAPQAGSSLQRVPASDGTYETDEGALTAFTLDNMITPKAAWSAPAPAQGTGDTADDGSSSPNQALDSPRITELLPNPASPATDEQDEFIELYNPNAQLFNLKGYTLETGTTILHDFTFTSDTVLPPNGYVSFTSAVTGLSLSNNGGQARLLDASGNILSQTPLYGAAPDGQAWAVDPQDDSAWQWTTTPTPGEVNLLTLPSASTVTKTTKSMKKTKVSGVKKVKTAKKKTTKAKKSKKTKKKKTAALLASASNINQTPTVTPIHPATLALVAMLAVAYGIYEYRLDLANRFYRLRKHYTSRRNARAPA